MKYENISLEIFSIVGIAVRTTNKNNQAQHDIHELWKKFLENNIANSIPNKVSEDIYCVYTDYESDLMGNYTTIVGCKVSNADNINGELIWKEISAANYYKFTSEGNIMETLNQTWMHIWQSDYDRAYTADFDVYGQEAKNPEDGKVFTYLSIK